MSPTLDALYRYVKQLEQRFEAVLIALDEQKQEISRLRQRIDREALVLVPLEQYMEDLRKAGFRSNLEVVNVSTVKIYSVLRWLDIIIAEKTKYNVPFPEFIGKDDFFRQYQDFCLHEEIRLGHVMPDVHCKDKQPFSRILHALGVQSIQKGRKRIYFYRFPSDSIYFAALVKLHLEDMPNIERIYEKPPSSKERLEVPPQPVPINPFHRDIPSIKVDQEKYDQWKKQKQDQSDN